MSSEDQKRSAARYAAGLVESGMCVGLGSGTTSTIVVDELGRRFRSGLRFTGVATSEETANRAESYGIPLRPLEDTALDLAIDGADEVDPQLDLIKGHGGALVREKLVAAAAKRFVVVVDESKLVSRLGEHFSIPVEVVTFGWTATRRRLEKLGLSCRVRGESTPFLTLNDNFILDCVVEGRRPAALAGEIKHQTGVVDHGLFLQMASLVVVGRGSGSVEVLSG